MSLVKHEVALRVRVHSFALVCPYISTTTEKQSSIVESIVVYSLRDACHCTSAVPVCIVVESDRENPGDVPIAHNNLRRDAYARASPAREARICFNELTLRSTGGGVVIRIRTHDEPKKNMHPPHVYTLCLVQFTASPRDNANEYIRCVQLTDSEQMSGTSQFSSSAGERAC